MLCSWSCWVPLPEGRLNQSAFEIVKEKSYCTDAVARDRLKG